MSENFEFTLKEITLQKMLDVKKQMGYGDKNLTLKLYFITR